MSKGISLHIGVDYVDVGHYGSEQRLHGCIQDAAVMQKIADSMGYQSNILLDADATTRNLIMHIREASEQLQAGDTFFISYSGHGGQLPDLSGDEGGNDETLCLFDRQYRDDEFNRQLARLSEGVKIIWVSDSCHAAYNFKGVDEASNEPDTELVKTIGMDASVEIVKANKDAYQHWMSGGDFLKSSTPELPASLIQLAACQEDQLSRASHEDDPDPMSLFTRALLNVWNNGSFNGTYEQLVHQVRGLIPGIYNQTPQVVLGGQETTQFATTKPFAI